VAFSTKIASVAAIKKAAILDCPQKVRHLMGAFL
jgi:hypothetical protein